MCPQNNHFFPALRHVIEGQEDCLYLNVYTPDADKQLPVMFWIHGGGFVAGHSGPSLYGPDYFMDKDVVFVSFNYRLGLLGKCSRFRTSTGVWITAVRMFRIRQHGRRRDAGQLRDEGPGNGVALGPGERRQVRRRSRTGDDFRRERGRR